MEALNKRQRKICNYIFYLTKHNGVTPTFKELVNELQPKSIQDFQTELQTLSKKGLICYVSNREHTINLVNNNVVTFQLPIIGKIAAGNPIEPLQTSQVLDLTDLMLGPNRFVLEVIGDSMSGDNIRQGDYIICERRNHADDGEIVVAIINDSEATLKRFKKNQDGSITLLPSNPDHSPVVYAADEVKIQGVYLGLIRLMKNNENIP